jgi:hypothetical protein
MRLSEDLEVKAILRVEVVDHTDMKRSEVRRYPLESYFSSQGNVG